MNAKTKDRPVATLAAIARSFGHDAASEKERLLDVILETARFSGRDLRLLLDTLCFLLAYPDNPRVLARTRRAAGLLRDWGGRVRGGARQAPALTDCGYPGGSNFHPFALPVLQRMAWVFPGCFELHWEEFFGGDTLLNNLGLFVAPAECAGLDSISLSMEEWVRLTKGAESTDLEFLLSLFAQSNIGPFAAEVMWESCDVSVRYHLSQEGTGCSEIFWPVEKTHYQRGPVRNERVPLGPAIRKPLPASRTLSAARGRAFIDFGLASLCARNLEIRTLTYANEEDIHLVDCGRGMMIGLIGVVPDYRDALESHYCCFVLKNGIAIAYGPASVHFACCEMGLNLFPDYRGSEIRWIYPQFMRAIHHVLGAEFFFLTAYGMGEGNPEAIKSGAFWFYRKLGFHAANPEVEELARAEEERMQRQPGYRSDRRTLVRLSPTEAYFDLSGGKSERFDLAAIGVKVSRMIATKFHGDRATAEAACARRVSREVGLTENRDEGTTRALRLIAPILCVIEGFAEWSKADKNRMRRIIQAKAGKSEAKIGRMLSEHKTLRAALPALDVGT